MPGSWHNAMENRFPENIREITFFCSSKKTNTNTCRRAYIHLSNNRTCEIKHSYISENQIVDRFNDWNTFGKEIIWLVDGNEGIELDKLSTGNYLLIFKQYWKYKSFVKTYKYILIEKDNLVFKIELDKIKSNMIELREPKTLDETINFLKTQPEKIWDFWSDENVVKSIMCVYQQGAGNGKTYSIWKSITENTDRKTYVIVTKQHSAKTVIYEELIDQKKRFENGEEIYHIENLTEETNDHTYSHYVIKYTHKISKRECIVIIGTIDSFCYNLADSNSKGANHFEGIVDNIKENGATKTNNGYLKFGGQCIQLSKESEIWIDEVQDLPENYYHAMVKLIYETSCYMNVVGDKLQSLEFSNNFLTNIISEGLPNIEIDIKTPINENRRIKVTAMETFINNLVNFKKYELPEIKCDDDIPKTENNKPIKLINSPQIYANDTDDSKVNKFCDEIMDLYKNEVNIHSYNPNDFLIIFPVMKGNVIATELQTKIQEYWVKKNKDEGYTQYVHLHKHTEGKVINTNDSINSTRIMSIKSSKGDGRKVVFILGVDEKSLKLVSNNELGLVYDSHLHVALTRAKNQIYFGLIKNNDDIHQRFGENGYTDYLNRLSKNINLDKINEIINKDVLIDVLINNNVNFKKLIEEQTTIDNSDIVDWGYHCIKYYAFYYNVILNIVNNKQNNVPKDKSQLFVKLNIISTYKLVYYNVSDFYKFLNKYQYKQFTGFPICKLSNKSDYIKYGEIIQNAMLKVQKCIKKNTIDELSVYESIILTYMIQLETSRKYCDISPVELYNITDFFQKDKNKETELLNNISNIKTIINSSGIKEYTNINWNICKHIELNSNYDYFKISKLQFPIIGNNETDVIHIVLKSDISQLNFWDIMIEVFLERFLIYNPKSDEDKLKFKDKKINTYLFLLNKNNFVKIDWDWDKKMCINIKQELKTSLEKYFINNHDNIYNYFTSIKNNKKELWDQEPDKIIDEMIRKCNEYKNYPDYIIKVLEDVNTKIEDDEDYNYVNNPSKFKKKLEKKLELHLKKYLI